MITAAAIWCLTVAIATVVQIQLIHVCLRRFRSYQTAAISDAELPRAAVILCLRGSDPYLSECLERLTDQDYPEYDLWIVLDSPSDPARAIAEYWRTASPRARVRLTFLDEISVRTSLKCSSLIHGIKQLDERIETAVLVDADTITYRSWLRNMVVPLLGGDYGVVTGSRWYDPSAKCWGSQLRFVYNSLALVPMYLMNAVWPGSMSLHRKVFANPKLIERLAQAPCEDDAVLRTLHESGLRLLNTPACVMLNREECGITSCFSFVLRQLLWTRLSNPAWRSVLAGTLVTYAWLLGGLGIFGLLCLYGPPSAALFLGAFMLCILTVNVALIAGLHRSVSQQIEQTAGLSPIPVSWRMGLRIAASLLLLISFYTAAAVSAALVRRIRWRGVSYVVQSSQRIEMVKYVPYERSAIYAIPNHSL